MSSNKSITQKCFKNDTNKLYKFNTIIKKNELLKYQNNRLNSLKITDLSVLKRKKEKILCET